MLKYTTICLGNILAVGNKSYETFQTFDPLIPVLGIYPKEITQKGKKCNLCKDVHVLLFIGVKNLEISQMPNKEMSLQIMV